MMESAASMDMSRQDTILSSVDLDDADSDFEYLTLPETDLDYLDTTDQLDQTVDVPVKIPFSSIHKAPLKFDSNDRKCFLPGRKIHVEVYEVERAPPHTKILNPNLYIIRLKHGDAEWVIRRRYKHFRHLHERMMLIRAGLTIPVPSKGHRERRKSFLLRKQGLPKFPKMPDPLVRLENMEERKQQLQDYLQNLMRCPTFRNDVETLKFLEVSHLSFVNNLGGKRKEGIVKKRSGGRRINLGFCGCCKKLGCNAAAHWTQRWLIVKDTFVAYISEDGIVCDVLLMDGDFKTVCGISSTGNKHVLLISNLSRHLLLKCWTARKAREWMETIKEAAKTTGQDFTKPNRYNSFAPMRADTQAQWFVDGAGYFSSVASSLESAKEEIFITDWWLSPEIYMKRPITDGDYWRLDVILKRKADAGVKVFVLLYKEMEVALGLNSYYTKQTLVRLNHDNIKVLRHPDGISLWAHHEKLVIIDQKIAYMGGLDLCYGRWDDQRHKLTDLGLSHEPSPEYNTGGSTITNAPVSTETVTLEVIHEEGQGDGKVRTNGDKERQLGKTDISLENNKVQEKRDPNSNVTTTVNSDKEPVSSDSNDHDSGIPDVSSVSSLDKSPDVTKNEEAGVSDAALSSSENGDSVKSSTELPAADLNAESSKGKGTRPPLKKSKGSEIKEDEEVLVTEDDEVPELSVIKSSSKAKGRNERFGKSGRSVSLDYQDLSSFKVSVINPDGSAEKMVTPDTPKSFTIVGESFNGRDQAPWPELERDCCDAKHQGQEPDSPSDKKVTVDFITPVKSEKYTSRSYSSPEERITSTPIKVQEKKKAKRPKMLNLRAFKSVDETKSYRVDGTDDPKGFPNKTSTPLDLSMFENPLNYTPKPSTPKQKRKFEIKVDEFKQDIRDLRDKFRKNRSKSTDNELDDNILEEFYKPIQAEEEDSTRLWIGKDYTNFIHKDFVDLDQPFTDFIDRTRTPRMPWHDIAGVVYGKPARDLARHFIQRWNFTKLQKMKKDPRYPLLLPKSYEKAAYVSPYNVATSVCCNCQVLRSAGEWSTGIQHTETSIHNAYIDCITNAKHFIYIENQFFISIIDHEVVENKIAEALFNRIKKAHEEGELFRVYVMMPLLPAFEGEIGTSSGTSIQQIINWNYQSICRGGRSLLSRLAAEVGDTTKYISFYGLRKHEELDEKLVSELIYVHSKLMIVDDNTVIMGSANINDRSMMGNRDSEMAILIQDTQTIQSRMNGKDYRAGKFAATLRRSLFREHLGVTELDKEMDVTDPVIPEFYKNIWVKHAALNTSIFEKVFNCIPCDSVRSFQQLYVYQAGQPLAVSDPDKAKEQLQKVKGHVVLMSLHFLADENNLSPSMATKEAYAPTVVWT